MASPNFLERFKGKTSTMSSIGILETNPNRAVNLQKFQSKSVMQMSANTILRSTPISSPYTPQPMSSTSKPASIASEPTKKSPLRNAFRSSSRPSVEHFMQASSRLPKAHSTSYPSNKRLVQYSPYSLRDYQNQQIGKYYQLGGLGPLNVGTSQ